MSREKPTIPISCPECSKTIFLYSHKTNLTKCQHCFHLLEKSAITGNWNTANLFPVQDKYSQLQPGTTGIIEGRPFILTGRFNLWFDESILQCWTVQVDRDELFYLVEWDTQCYFYKPNSELKSAGKLQLNSTQPGKFRSLEKGIRYLLCSKQTVHHREMEGESVMPFIHEKLVLYEFKSAEGKIIHIFQKNEKELLSFYALPVHKFKLELGNLRQESASQRELTCESCSAKWSLKAYPHTRSFTCPSCGSQYQFTTGKSFRLNSRYKEGSGPFYLELGEQGTLFGRSYEVIGIQQKEEQNQYASNWREYTLWNSYHGYAFLSEYDGHWIFLEKKAEHPVLFGTSEKEFSFFGEPFQLFNSYTYKIITARGECIGNISDGIKTRVSEFISPPEMWIEERGDDSIIWLHAQHLGNNQLKKAFNKDYTLNKSGVGAIQPTGFVNPVKLIAVTAVGVLLLLLIHSFNNQFKRNEVLLDREIFFPKNEQKASLVTTALKLVKPTGNLKFHIVAPVSNSWFSLEATARDTKTGKEYSMEQGVEYYYGTDSDGSWTEGSKSEDGYLTGIPGGEYVIELNAVRQLYPSGTDRYYLTITYDTPSSRNFWMAAVLLLLWPAGKYLSMTYYEKRRWSNSPYSIYD
jgi:predicted RNA-binding Zn-ribbon protein involved in translation (DUF1610 family)